MNRSAAEAPAEPATGPVRLLAWLVAALALVTGALALDFWTAPGSVPNADAWTAPWPLGFAAVLLLLGVLARVRGRGAPEFALAALAWALAVTAAVELPAWSSAFHIGDGPALVPLYIALSLVGGLFALGELPRRMGGGAPRAVRAAALLLLFTAANGKAWTREGELVFPLLAAAVLLVWSLEERRWSFAALVRTPLGAIALALVLWTLAAALAADNPRRGLWFWMRVVTGALAAWTLAGALDARGAARAALALSAAAAVALLLLAVGWLDLVPVAGFERLLNTRLRLFDLHANGIGPFFALSSLACLGFAVGARGAPRVLLTALAALAALALWRTESRASLLGFGLGFAVLLIGASGRLPRHPRRWAGAALALAAGGALALASPLFGSAGAGVRARLHDLTLTSSALGQRVHFWEMALAVLRDSPWLGAGPAQYHVHTRYALPSFYDGTAQDLHTHNLPLAVAEGAGWPALVLFALLVAGVFELGCRALRSAEDGAQRGAALALTSGLAAVLGSNLLDLGQSQTTFLPLLLWTALGLLAALAGVAPASASSAPRRRSNTARTVVALVLLVPLGLLPAASLLLFRAGNLDQARLKTALALGDPETASAAARRALSRYELARDLIGGLYDRPGYSIVTLHRLVGSAEDALAAQVAVCEAAPGRARSRFALAKLELENGRPARARRSIELARELDPYGPDRGNYELGLAWAALAAGRPDQARAHLARGLWLGGGLLERLPHTDLPLLPGDPDAGRDDASRLALVPTGLRGAERVPLPLDEIFDELLERASLEATVDGRRTVIRIANHYRGRGRLERALATIEQAQAAEPRPLGSTLLLQAKLLGELGRTDAARLVLEQMSDWSYGSGWAAETYALVLSGSDDPADRQRAWELASELEYSASRDLFFDAGNVQENQRMLFDLALDQADFERALARARFLVFDTEQVADRVAAASRCFNRMGRAAKRDGGPEARAAALELLELLLQQAALDRTTALNTAAMRQRALNLRRWWTGEDPEQLERIARRLAERHGLAGETFWSAWQG